MQRGGQCAILKNEIRAAPGAVTLAKVFRTQCRMKKEGKTIRAAKCYFGAGTARLSEARISKTHPRKGTETKGASREPRLRPRAISKTHPRKGTETMRVTCGDGRCRGNISKTHPRKGTETNSLPTCISRYAFSFQKHIPARGRKLAHDVRDVESKRFISKTHPRKGTETRK